MPRYSSWPDKVGGPQQPDTSAPMRTLAPARTQRNKLDIRLSSINKSRQRQPIVCRSPRHVDIQHARQKHHHTLGGYVPDIWQVARSEVAAPSFFAVFSAKRMSFVHDKIKHIIPRQRLVSLQVHTGPATCVVSGLLGPPPCLYHALTVHFDCTVSCQSNFSTGRQIHRPTQRLLYNTRERFIDIVHLIPSNLEDALLRRVPKGTTTVSDPCRILPPLLYATTMSSALCYCFHMLASPPLSLVQ